MNKEGGVAIKKKVAIITTVVMLLVLVFLSVGIAYRLSKSDSSQDFSSKELVVRSTNSEAIKGYSSKEVVGDLTVFKFESEAEAKK